MSYNNTLSSDEDTTEDTNNTNLTFEAAGISAAPQTITTPIVSASSLILATTNIEEEMSVSQMTTFIYSGGDSSTLGSQWQKHCDKFDLCVDMNDLPDTKFDKRKKAMFAQRSLAINA